MLSLAPRTLLFPVTVFPQQECSDSIQALADLQVQFLIARSLDLTRRVFVATGFAHVPGGNSAEVSFRSARRAFPGSRLASSDLDEG